MVAGIPIGVLGQLLELVGLPPQGSADVRETVGTVFSIAMLLVGTWMMLARVDHRPWQWVGLGRAGAEPRRIVVGFLIGGGAIALAIGALIVVGWLRLESVLGVVAGHPMLRLTALLIPAALMEELVTRGYILTAMREAMGWPAAIAVTSVGFGLLHLKNPGADLQSLTLVMLAGVFLAVVRVATDSLYATWSAHFSWNWVMGVLFHAPISGRAFSFPSYRYVDAGPDWATGGVWGPEGGFVAGVAMIGAVIVLLRMGTGNWER